MKCIRYLVLVSSMMILATTILAGEFNVHLKVLDSNDKPIPEFEVRAHSHEQGFAPWRKGKEGEILLRSKDNDFPIFGSALHYQVIIRAMGFAPEIIEMDRPEKNIERTVRLTKGQCIEMVLKAKNCRAIPESLMPLVILPGFQRRAWLSFQHKGKYESDYNFTSLVKVKAGHYTFNIADDSPQIYVFIDQTGFMRAFRAGPFGKEELADGKLEIELPKPAELEIVVKPPKELLEKLPYDVWSVDIIRQSPDDETTGYPLASIKSDKMDMRIDREFLAPGGYWITFQTGPADRSVKFESGRVNPAYYRDMRRYSFAPGQVEKVVFRYTAYDDNRYKGDYSAIINVRWHNGKPAAEVRYSLFYNDKHFGSVNIQEGKIADNGRIKLTGLAGGDDGPYFTLVVDSGKLGRYLFQLLGEGKNRVLEYKIAPLEGNKAPDITVLDVFTGEEVKLSDYRGKVIFVEFWATGCGPCQRPMAHLCEIASRRKADWEGKALLLCISIDEKKEHVINHVRNHGWLAVRHLWCHKGEPGWKSDAAQKYGITGVPTSLIIDQSGTIVWRGHPRLIDIEAKIDELLSTEKRKNG